MRSVAKDTLGIVAALVALVAFLPQAPAKGLDDFTLTKAIPADAFLAVHARDHAGREFLDKQFERFWNAVAAAHFDRDLKRLLKGIQKQNLPPGEELQGFDEQWQEIQDLLSGVEWSQLAKREYAMGMKIGFPTPEFVVLMMPPKDQLKGDFEGLVGIMKKLAGIDPKAMQLSEQDDGDTLIRKLDIVGAPVPLGLTLVRHGEVLMLGFGSTMPEQALALLRGEAGETLASTERFQQAFEQLPAPTDGLVFVDVDRLFKQIRGVVATGIQMSAGAAPAEGEPGYDDYVKGTKLPGKIFDAVDMFDYAATVMRTDGMRTEEDSILRLRDNAKSYPLYPVLFNNKPLTEPLKYIPANAQDFMATSGVDLHALYKAVIKIIGDDVPHGQDVLDKIEALKDKENGPGIDIENDYIKWIGGGVSMFSVAGATPYSPSEFVVMLSVRDEKTAQARIDQLLGLIEPMLAQQNGTITPAEIEGVDGFKAVSMPSLVMFGVNKPTLGVKDGWAFLGSSPAIIKTALDVAAGEKPNIAKSERFIKEGVPPKGAVTAISFTDMTSLGDGLSKVLSMVPMIGMMAAQQGQSNPFLQAIVSMAGRAARVVRKLDFFQSKASCTTFDGKTLRTKAVVNYREPPVLNKPKPKTSGSDNEPAESGEKGGEKKE